MANERNQEREEAFGEVINFIAKEIEGSWFRPEGRGFARCKAAHVRDYMERHLAQHGRLPFGIHYLGFARPTKRAALPLGSDRNLHVGETDFDTLTANAMRRLEHQRWEAALEEEMDKYPQCPFCESTTGCEHTLACIDFQYNEVMGGTMYERGSELEEPIRAAFRKAYASGTVQPEFYRSVRLMELWKQGEPGHSEDPLEVSLHAPSLARFFVDALKAAGATGDIEELTSGPGWTSDHCTLFAEDPDRVIEACKTALINELSGK